MAHRADALSRPRPAPRRRGGGRWRHALLPDPRAGSSWPGSAGSWSCRCPTSRTSGRPPPLDAPGRRLPRGRAGAAVRAVAPRQRTPGAEPRREPAAAAADRARRRSDRRCRDRPGTTGRSGCLASAGRSSRGSGSRWASSWEPPASGSRPCSPAGSAGSAPGRSGSLWACPSCSKSGLGPGALGRGGEDRHRTPRPMPHPEPHALFHRFRPGRRSVPARHGAGGDASDDRFRRHRVSPARAEGVLPGRADRLSPPQRLYEHAVRRGDAPPAGDGSARRLVVGGPGRPVARGVLRARGGGPDRGDGETLGLAARGLVRGARLPDDPLGLPAGGVALRRRTALRLPRSLDLGAGPGMDVDRRGAAPGSGSGASPGSWPEGRWPASTLR